MFRCNKKRADWYLSRNLASIIKKNPLTIQLNFTPNGLGNYKKGYGLSEMHNVCVNCGSENDLTKHHVIPISYRKYFPIKIKSHNFHDVLPMCVRCHENYERKADIRKKELSIQYAAPLDGEIITKEDFTKYSKMAQALLRDIKIPTKRKLEIRNQIKSHFNIKKLTKKEIKRISELKSTVVKKTHGEIVISKIKNVQSFITMWRKHFIENNECLFLPQNWNINYK